MIVFLNMLIIMKTRDSNAHPGWRGKSLAHQLNCAAALLTQNIIFAAKRLPTTCTTHKYL